MPRGQRSGHRTCRGRPPPRATAAPDPRPAPPPARPSSCASAPARQAWRSSAVAARDGKSGRSGIDCSAACSAAVMTPICETAAIASAGSADAPPRCPSIQAHASPWAGTRDCTMPAAAGSAVVRDVAHRPGGQRRMGEAALGEQLQQLNLGIDAGLQQSVDLEHEPIAKPHGAVRLLDAHRPLRQAVGLGSAAGQQLGQRRSRLQHQAAVAARQHSRPIRHQRDQGPPHAIAIGCLAGTIGRIDGRNEISLLRAIGERRQQHQQHRVTGGQLDAVVDLHRPERARLAAEPPLLDQPCGEPRRVEWQPAGHSAPSAPSVSSNQ